MTAGHKQTFQIYLENKIANKIADVTKMQLHFIFILMPHCERSQK